MFDSEKDFCYEFARGKLVASSSTQIVTYIIAVVNILLRNFNKMLIQRVGYGLESVTFKYITLAIFWTSFFNSAILLVLANADFRPYWWKFIPLRNQFPDQSTNWNIMMGPALV